VTSPVTEGSVATLKGTIVDPDPGDTFFLNVNWGDSTPPESFSFAPGTPRDVTLQHQYLNNPAGSPNGAFTIGLNWHDDQGAGSSASLQVVVQNVTPTVAPAPKATLRLGQTLTRLDTVTDPGQDLLTTTVNFGDGSGNQALSVNPNRQFQLKHRYRKAGTFHVTVTVRDSDGGVSTSTFQVVVKRPH
jgi:hypothetical protein